MGTKAGDASTDPAETVLRASRALVAVAAASIAAVEEQADIVEVRVLAVVSARGSVALREVADGLGLHVSTASRLCDRMVDRGLLHRQDDPADRRQLALSLTGDGTRVVDRMRGHRRRSVDQILSRMPGDQRRRMAAAFEAFAVAAGDISERDLWSVGWTH